MDAPPAFVMDGFIAHSDSKIRGLNLLKRPTKDKQTFELCSFIKGVNKKNYTTKNCFLIKFTFYM
jgi:hypothetical protein